MEYGFTTFVIVKYNCCQFMNNPKISVIVPVYNIEKYLSRCVSSILAQSFTDFELLLIDDGSFDDSGNICDKYALTDERVRVFHKENGGVSSARNLGLEKARGEYVMFIDGDDSISVETLNVCYDISCSKKLDCLQFSYRQINDKGTCLFCNSYSIEVCPGIEYFNFNKCLYTVWGSCIRKKLLWDNDIAFNKELKLGEDQLFIMRVCYYSKNVARIPNVLYNYMENATSATKNTQYTDLLISIRSFLKFNSEYRCFNRNTNLMLVGFIIDALAKKESQIDTVYVLVKNYNFRITCFSKLFFLYTLTTKINLYIALILTKRLVKYRKF